MVATRRSSQRLQEKTTSAPSSPVTSNTSTPTRAPRKATDSATKKSPSTGSSTKGNRGAKNAAEEQSDARQQLEQQNESAESTEEDERSSRDEVTKELFQVAESTQSVQQHTIAVIKETVSEERKNEESATGEEQEVVVVEQVETTTVTTTETTTTEVVVVEAQQQIEDEAGADSQATEDEEEEEEVLLMVDSEGEEEQDDDVAGEKDDDEAEEDISAYVMMAASGINLSTTKPSASSSLQSKTSESSRFNLVPDALDSGASQHATYFAFQGYKCADGATLVTEKRALEEQATLKSQLQVAAQSTRQREEHQNKKSAGRKWFDMESEELTAEARRDFALLRMRNYLDPKKFYKTSDHHKKLPKHFQMGVVIEGAHEFKSARLTKKQRQQTFTDEIMADSGIQSYTKRVFGQIQASRSGQGKKKKMKPSKRY